MLQSFRPAKAIKRRVPLSFDALEDRTVLSSSRIFAGLEFVTPGKFLTETTPIGSEVRTDGPVQVGMVPAKGAEFLPLLEFTKGVSFHEGDTTGHFTGHGELAAIVGGHDIELAAAADRELSAVSLINRGLGLAGGQS